MRSDKAKSLHKVAAALVKNPLGSVRELAAESGVSFRTAARMKQTEEMAQIGTKSPFVASVLEKDASIIRKGQAIIDGRLDDPDEVAKMRTKEVSEVIKESAARYAIFRGGVTDSEGGLKEPKDYTHQEILAALNG
jgi:DNA-binding transcriptional regulator YhcF (GntR family)